MVNLNSTITLIGTRLAKIGNEFIFYGHPPDCEDCKLKNTCNSLETGNRYKITGVRDGQVHACAVHDTGVYAVEVIPAPTIALVESKLAFNGSKIVYETPDCNEVDCPDYDRCHPAGLKIGDKYTIVELLKEEPSKCLKGYSMEAVVLR